MKTDYSKITLITGAMGAGKTKLATALLESKHHQHTLGEACVIDAAQGTIVGAYSAGEHLHLLPHVSTKLTRKALNKATKDFGQVIITTEDTGLLIDLGVTGYRRLHISTGVGTNAAK